MQKMDEDKGVNLALIATKQEVLAITTCLCFVKAPILLFSYSMSQIKFIFKNTLMDCDYIPQVSMDEAEKLAKKEGKKT